MRVSLRFMILLSLPMCTNTESSPSPNAQLEATEPKPQTLCPADLSLCAQSCQDLSNDPAHCGACATACDNNSLCVEGACVAGNACSSTRGCPWSYYCDGNVGRCRYGCLVDDQCPSPWVCDKASHTCGAGAAKNVCPSGESLCDGTCSDLSLDNEHCGACTNACAAAEVCVSGACEPLAQGACPQVSCPQGSYCGSAGQCLAGCSGNAECAAFHVCDASHKCVCPPGQTECGGLCVETSTNKNHCGSCANTCAANAMCLGGQCQGCTPECTGRVCGDNACAGSCGSCGTGESCINGQCGDASCQIGTSRCNDGGVDVCLPWGWSSLGPCAEGCADGACLCAPKCSAKTCGSDGCGGSCGSCGSGNVCNNGQCQLACTEGAKQCAANGNLQVCSGGLWVENAACTNGCQFGVCNPPPRACRNGGAACSLSAECASDFVCTSLDIAPCSQDSIVCSCVVSSLSCSTGQTACTSSLDCCSGYRCNGVCELACRTTAQYCRRDSECCNGTCSPIPGNCHGMCN